MFLPHAEAWHLPLSVGQVILPQTRHRTSLWEQTGCPQIEHEPTPQVPQCSRLQTLHGRMQLGQAMWPLAHRWTTAVASRQTSHTASPISSVSASNTIHFSS